MKISRKLWKIAMASAVGAVAFSAGMYAFGGIEEVRAQNVESSDVVALTIGEETTNYESFGAAYEAAEAAGESAKITLLADTVADFNDWIMVDLTIDLNGYTISEICLSIDTETPVDIVLEDSSATQTGRYIDTAGIAHTMYAGSITINSGTYDISIAITAYSSNPATVTVNGGEFINGTFTTDDESNTNNSVCEIKGGYFHSAYFSDYADIIQVTGGEYVYMYSLSLDENSQHHPLSRVMADGYKLFDGNRTAVNMDTFILYEILLDENGDIVYDENGNAVYTSRYSVLYHPECDGYDYYLFDKEHHWLGCWCGATDGEPVKTAHEWAYGRCEYCNVRHEHDQLDEKGYCETCKLQSKVIVCVGEEERYYDDLMYAFERMPEGATVKLLQDAWIEGTQELEKAITIDMNGFDILTPSSYAIILKAAVVFKDSVGGGTCEIPVVLETIATLESGRYNGLLFSEGVKPSDVLLPGRHFYDQDADESTDSPLADDAERLEWVKIVYDCKHTEWTWEYDEETHKRTCSVCEYETEEAAHEYGDWTVTKESTEEETGLKEKACECGHTVEETIPVVEPEQPEQPEQPQGEQGGENAGCGGVLGGGAVAMATLVAAALMMRRKKKIDA